MAPMLLQIRLEKVTIAPSLDAGLEDAGALQNTCDPTAEEMDCAGWQGATIRATNCRNASGAKHITN